MYSICIMNFNYEQHPVLRRDIQLCDINTKEFFSDKLNIILIQMPCANGLQFSECNKYYEYLLILLQQMHDGMKTKDELKREVAETRLPEGTKELFYKVLDTADYAALSEEEQMRYESNLKNYMDTMSCIRFARKEGISEGFEEGREKGREEGMEQGLKQGLEKGRAEGHAEGLEKGRAEGRNECNIEVAKSMKAKGLDLSLIAECTGLTIDELQKL